MEIKKRDIEQLIVVRKKDIFKHHLETIFTNNYEVTGDITSNEIKVWRQNAWNKTIYPVFSFQLNANDTLVNIKHKLNPVGKLLLGSLVLGLSFLICPKAFATIYLPNHWPIISIIAVALVIIALLVVVLYRFEKQNQLQEIFELLESPEAHKEPEKCHLKRLGMRLLAYPFYLYLIYLTIRHVIPTGNVPLAFSTLGFSGIYFFTEVSMLFKLWKNSKTVI